MTNLDSILKSRDITLLTKLCLVKAMVFPVVMCGCEKGRSESEVSQSCPTLCDPMDCSLPGSSIHGIFQTTVLECCPILLPFPLSGDLPNPGGEPKSQGIFPTQGVNPSLLHCKQTLLPSEPPEKWMWELNHKEGWTLKNWCFWTVVLEKTLESPLDCKEIQPVHPKGDQLWIYHIQLSVTPWTIYITHQAPLSIRNTAVGCHVLFQGIFPTQGSNPGLPHFGQMLYPLNHQGSLNIY